MSSMMQKAAPDAAPRRGLPRWAWVLIALLAVIAVVAVAIAVFASRGRQVIVLPPAPTAPAVSPGPSAAPSAPAVTIADGCLGGAGELDQAALTAQRDAPLTPAGAASFTATLIRWGTAIPAAPYQDVTARQLLAARATDKAKQFRSGARSNDGATGSISFAAGRYYVEAFDGTSAIVSYVGTGTGTLNGAVLQPAWLAGAAHLVAQNGTWHFQDLSSERPIPDLLAVGTPYSGGC